MVLCDFTLMLYVGIKDKCCGLETNDFYRRNERSVGRLYRQIRLPLNAVYYKADILYLDGLLCFTIPKTQPDHQLQIK